MSFLAVTALLSLTDPRVYEGPEAVPARADVEASRPTGGADTPPPTGGESGEAAVPPTPPPSPVEGPRPDAGDPGEEVPEARTIIVHEEPHALSLDRAVTTVDRRDIERRMPRSAPDALRDEPGVHIQRSGHAQASPYVRGMTGQRVALSFDGVRLNNSTFRQGPNQYVFTLDAASIARLEVLRGGASTRFGSDAMGGALQAMPVLAPLATPGKSVHHGYGELVARSADTEAGGRAQAEGGYGGKFGWVAGVGYRDVGPLRTGGPVDSPALGEPHLAQRILDDGTMPGTGFRELTADARLTWRINSRLELTGAYYDYRQFDAPRADQCPPPGAPLDECFRYAQQFRTLGYAALQSREGPAFAETVRWTVSVQNQHERATKPAAGALSTSNDWLDTVTTYGTAIVARTARREWKHGDLGGRWGLDAYLDDVDSQWWLTFSDGSIDRRPRGQFVRGSRYLTSGLWSEVSSNLAERVRLRGGIRGAWVRASAPAVAGDAAAGPTEALSAGWLTATGGGGVRVRATPWLDVDLGADQGFRAPNLSDLSARRSFAAGVGYEQGSPGLRPERSTTYELGLRAFNSWLSLAAWAYATDLRDTIVRDRRDAGACPREAPGCATAPFNHQFANLEQRARILGAEASAKVWLPRGLTARGVVSYAHGEGPNLVPTAAAICGVTPSRAPLSRIPPLSGVGEFNWEGGPWSFGTGLRWARLQDRCAVADQDDTRIPAGGTPGYVLWDIRAGYRLGRRWLTTLNLENLTDAAARTHGSAVNEPGFGASFRVRLGF